MRPRCLGRAAPKSFIETIGVLKRSLSNGLAGTSGSLALGGHREWKMRKGLDEMREAAEMIDRSGDLLSNWAAEGDRTRK